MVQQLRYRVPGMSCEHCVRAISGEVSAVHGVSEVEGVSADVNFASEHAAVRFDPDSVDVDRLIAAVEAAGYEAALPEAAVEGDPGFGGRLACGEEAPCGCPQVLEDVDEVADDRHLHRAWR